MSSEKFTGGRGIIPIATAKVQVPGWTLAFNIPGLPYSEPTFTSIVPRKWQGKDDDLRESFDSNVLGVVYLITQDQYIHVLESEGGGTAYEDIEIDALPLDEKDAELTGPRVKARTLGAAMERIPWPKPSERYMQIILAGALEVQMPDYYQQFLKSIPVYEPPENRRGKIGGAVFLMLWGPVMGAVEKITKASIGRNGLAPYPVILLVRFTMFMIWFTHDTLFAPVCGSGDGHKSNGRPTSGGKLTNSEKDLLLQERAGQLKCMV